MTDVRRLRLRVEVEGILALAVLLVACLLIVLKYHVFVNDDIPNSKLELCGFPRRATGTVNIPGFTAWSSVQCRTTVYTNRTAPSELFRTRDKDL